MSSSSSQHVLFVDQTGQLGGAEWWLLDLLQHRAATNPLQTPPIAPDQVALFDSGPFADRLGQLGIPTHLLTGGERATAVRKGDGWWSQLAAARGACQLSGQLAKLASSASLLYANTPKALVVAALVCRRHNIPLIYHLHDILSPDHFSSLNRRVLVALANRYAVQVVANSNATRDAFIAAGGDGRLVQVVYNGIDPGPHQQARQQREIHRAALREELGCDSAPIVTVFGRLSPWKGQRLAIEAIAELPEVHLLLVGEALFGEAAYAEQLHAAAQQPAVAGRVHFAGFRNDIPQLMQASDIILHCSTAPEPFGRVIVEGMMAAQPVIASDAGGASEIVTDGETGLLTTLGCVESLREAIQGILSCPEDAQQLALAGQEMALNRFDLVARIDDIHEIVGRFTLR